ncbi:XTP/dITP diphosphohydrolase [Evansella caseinilytica]|uniref:XTP/dITP diphosphohydrolase n=1 Tax=Evansella caseinilytica TaxID=1503961 RepID=A0A1H3U880_9BACI|nr:non-canonical purine NTP pyrophosphatase [Evansella caseinilytica]SDZ58634.1 XTP/dITP diphosphohydrolase [Evansella caseinilytica]
MKLIIATWNKAKFTWIRDALRPLPLEAAALADTIEDIEETAATFSGNASLKVEAVRRYYPNDIILGEDSGLMINALGGFPGVKTARFLPGSDADRAKELLRRLEGLPLSKRQAQFHSAVALATPDGQGILCSGTLAGWISNRERTCVQGYGDIFLLCNDKVLAAAEPTQLLPLDHRRQALFQAKQHILEWVGKD